MRISTKQWFAKINRFYIEKIKTANKKRLGPKYRFFKDGTTLLEFFKRWFLSSLCTSEGGRIGEKSTILMQVQKK
jgi:hypothetical protein